MNSISKFFKDNLDGKLAYVSSGGLLVEGQVESKVKLEFADHLGLLCLIKLEYNYKNLCENVDRLLVQNRNDLEISYDTRDKIVKLIIPFLKQSYVKAGTIMTHNVTKMEVSYLDNKIYSVGITYKNGSVTNITCIEDEKRTNTLL